MTYRPREFAPLLVTAAIIASVAAGCQGDVDGLDPGGEGTYAACTNYHSCCPPADMVCEGDVDTSTTCTCKQLWTCHPTSPKKCEGTRVVPSGGGSWSCTWSEEQYLCEQPGSKNPFPSGGQGSWSCKSASAGWSCSIPPPNPSNKPGGESAWSCTVNNTTDRIVCLRRETPACVPVKEVCGNNKDDDCDGKMDCADADCAAACMSKPEPDCVPVKEVCGNNKDDDCDGKVDCADADCTAACKPACVPVPEVCSNKKDDDCDGKVDCADADCTTACKPPPPPPCTTWKTVQCSGVGHCNTHLGDNLAACKAAGNAGGCSSSELYAWCTRRVPGLSGQGGPWWNYIKLWVEKKCGGKATLTWDDKKQHMDMYTCKNSTTCYTYKCETPLLLSFDPGSAVTFTPDDGRGAFDLSSDQDGTAARTDWPTATTPWLVLDRDGDGAISSGRELFGSATLVDGRPATNGFEALALLDENRDGVLDARDPGFAALALWSDRDGDRVSTPGELTTLAAVGVVSLSLRVHRRSSCDERGNCAVEHAGFSWRGPDGQSRRGEVVDVHLAVQPRPAAAARRPPPTCDASFKLHQD